MSTGPKLSHNNSNVNHNDDNNSNVLNDQSAPSSQEKSFARILEVLLVTWLFITSLTFLNHSQRGGHFPSLGDSNNETKTVVSRNCWNANIPSSRTAYPTISESISTPTVQNTSSNDGISKGKGKVKFKKVSLLSNTRLVSLFLLTLRLILNFFCFSARSYR